MKTQLELFEEVKTTKDTQEIKTIRIKRRFIFEKRLEPIPLPDFTEEMLYVEDEDPIVFKRCKICGSVFGFNTDSAYSRSLVECYTCGEKQFAREMSWKIPPKRRLNKGFFLNPADHKYYKLETEEDSIKR